MKRCTLAACLFIAVTVTAGHVKQPSGKSALRRSFEAKERTDSDCWGKESCYGMPADFVLGERWKNFQRYAAENTVDLSRIISVTTMKTDDTGEPVVTITDVDGREWLFWLKGDTGKVRALTNDAPLHPLVREGAK